MRAGRICGGKLAKTIHACIHTLFHVSPLKFQVHSRPQLQIVGKYGLSRMTMANWDMSSVSRSMRPISVTRFVARSVAGRWFICRRGCVYPVDFAARIKPHANSQARHRFAASKSATLHEAWQFSFSSAVRTVHSESLPQSQDTDSRHLVTSVVTRTWIGLFLEIREIFLKIRGLFFKTLTVGKWWLRFFLNTDG